ncbi:MAG: NUDIX domain-containing protein [Leptospiraceae bacterium]|nr:NUDIX domain-containing protein [Leptospiraceae bacterium]
MTSKHGLFQITQKVFIRNGNFLLVMKDKKSGAGDLPGGRMNQDEFFEDWMDSLNRELEEELGSNFNVEINPNPIIVHKHLVNDGNHPCVIIGYDAVYKSGEISISDEHDFYKWVDISSYKPEELFSEYMLDAVNVYLKRK